MSEKETMQDIGETVRQDIEQACQRLATSFAYLVDHRRYDELVALFTENCRYARPGLVVQGKADLYEFMLKRSEDVVSRHVCSPVFFEQVDQDRAEGVAYLTLYQASGRDSGIVEAQGPTAVAEMRYEFVRAGHGWRIAVLTAQPVFIFKS